MSDSKSPLKEAIDLRKEVHRAVRDIFVVLAMIWQELDIWLEVAVEAGS